MMDLIGRCDKCRGKTGGIKYLECGHFICSSDRKGREEWCPLCDIEKISGQCIYPACLHPPVIIYSGDKLCVIHLPPAGECKECGSDDWRRGLWGGWLCRVCWPRVGRKIRDEKVG